MNSNFFVLGASRPGAGYKVVVYERTTVALWCIRFEQQLLCITDQLSAHSCNRLGATTNRAIPSKYRFNTMALFAPKNSVCAVVKDWSYSLAVVG